MIDAQKNVILMDLGVVRYIGTTTLSEIEEK